jgi:hypothetical protein
MPLEAISLFILSLTAIFTASYANFLLVICRLGTAENKNIKE